MWGSSNSKRPNILFLKANKVKLTNQNAASATETSMVKTAKSLSHLATVEHLQSHNLMAEADKKSKDKSIEYYVKSDLRKSH